MSFESTPWMEMTIKVRSFGSLHPIAQGSLDALHSTKAALAFGSCDRQDHRDCQQMRAVDERDASIGLDQFGHDILNSRDSPFDGRLKRPRQ